MISYVTAVGACLWNRPLCGLGTGISHGVIALALRILLGKKASGAYLVGVVIYSLRQWIRPWTNRDRACVYAETLEFIQKGHYLAFRKVVSLQSGEDLFRKSSCVDCREFSIDLMKQTEIQVINQDCLEAAQSQVAKGHRVVVVNFASHDQPGGNSDRGALGLEEDLCRRSELAGFMNDQMLGISLEREQFYPLEQHPSRKDHLIHTPDVLVFRASQKHFYTVLGTPFQIGVLTSSAPVKPYLDGIEYVKKEDRERIRLSIITQLYAAHVNGYDTVILGAFGCGAYQNPPQAVARIYKEVLDKNFKGVFQRIVFAILDDSHRGLHNPEGNFKPFKECFQVLHGPNSPSITASDRVQVAAETLVCIQQGFYVNSKGEQVPLQSGKVLYEKSRCVAEMTTPPDKTRYATTEIFVLNQECLEAAQIQVEEGRNTVLACFSSPIEPGGGFEEGTTGQEEGLCYSSELAGLMKEVLSKFQNDEPQNLFPLNNHQDVLFKTATQLIHYKTVYTPEVTVFRKNAAHRYAFLDKPFKVGVLSSAAPVAPQLSVVNGVEDYKQETIREYMKTAITTQLYTAYVGGHDTVILGAFGCGAFKNPPQVVAKIYKEVIDEYFNGAFQRIVFAIVDDPYRKGNFSSFQQCFH